MTANDIIGDARVARVRELRAELTATKARLQEIESERDALLAHFDLALVALRDFEQIGPTGRLRIIDGWNTLLRGRNVSKLASEDISRLKTAYLANLGIVPKGTDPHSPPPPLTHWIVFDGAEENTYRSGPYRITYTGGTGAHRADRLILDYVHAAQRLGLDTSRITVETADKALANKLTDFGAEIAAENPIKACTAATSE